MKSFDSRAYSISDFIEWNRADQLELSPKFQRRSVWSDTAKSYLLDTILRGKPIPKVFIRQKINPTTQATYREVVDGQQRLRAILSFIQDGFTVSKRHNPELGGLFFSQLPEEDQRQVLGYEIAVDLLMNLPDEEILDIFGRLNSYSLVLKPQEKINAKYFGPFKLLADRVGRKYYEYWISQKILTERSIARMGEVELVADLLIAMTAGIQSKKSIAKFYGQYESDFPFNVDELEVKFDRIITLIGLAFPEGLARTEFHRNHLFYSLFTAFYHCEFGISNLAIEQIELSSKNPEHIRNSLDSVGVAFAAEDISQLQKADRDFLQDSRRATTDEPQRLRRTRYLLDKLS